MKPRLLDLFCGAGGASMGYSRAGFEVVGVDIKPQPHYPFEFIETDALCFLDVPPVEFDAIHASPPCQAHSTIAKQQRTRRHYAHPDHVAATRRMLEASGLPWVMENVQGAPMTNCVTLCGSSFGLDVRRHRLFELGHFDPVVAPSCAHGWQRPRFRSLDQRRNGKLASVVGVHGHVNYAGEATIREQAMGIDWMTQPELAQAIPPEYTFWIGTHLMSAIKTPMSGSLGSGERNSE